MFLVDLQKGQIISDEQLKNEIVTRNPYRQWLDQQQICLETLPLPETMPPSLSGELLIRQQRTFGYTTEDLKILMAPMALNGQEAIGSMGIDTPIAVLS